MKVTAECLSEEEIACSGEMFDKIDTDNSGQITFDELRDELGRFCADIDESSILDPMQCVSIACVARNQPVCLLTSEMTATLRIEIPGRYR